MFKTVKRVAVAMLRRCIFAVFKVFSSRRDYDGLAVWMMADSPAAEEVLSKVHRALQLIAEVDALRFRRIQRYLRCIVVGDQSGAVYVEELGACVLGLDLVNRASSTELASHIVHEATHAKFRRASVPVHPSLQGREEAVCVRESLAFLEKSTAGMAEAVRLREYVARELSSEQPWYTPDRTHAKYLADLERAKVPDWILRLLRRRPDSS